LADARLAGDEARPGVAGRCPLQGPGKARELAGASDEDRAADARHGADDTHRRILDRRGHLGSEREVTGMATAEPGSPRAPWVLRWPRVSPRAIPMNGTIQVKEWARLWRPFILRPDARLAGRRVSRVRCPRRTTRCRPSARRSSGRSGSPCWPA